MHKEQRIKILSYDVITKNVVDRHKTIVRIYKAGNRLVYTVVIIVFGIYTRF
jgi:hypothetical protein